MLSYVLVEKSSRVIQPVSLEIRVNTTKAMNVGMSINGVGVELSTVEAHKAGFKLCMMQRDILPNEHIKLTINGKSLPLSPNQALSIGGALLRKADQADDLQLARKSL